ncbi:tryptophan 7-halogenase [Luteolibacter arcticus]|uniref:Tryptophan 7-halogenase n=1 Tax=Luteolibacter arcticus TaxID=1581411 RepID=A0ABT3GG11_9BACT|nr:tryptophan 7-halogenase [Luteolibacter arcticus]MCW1921984.1 tryptophan 7-halogenase [Luteolibacter arcticus]
MNPLRNLVVAGSGTDALLAAVSIKRALPNLPVTLVRDPQAAAGDPAGESTVPSVLQHLVHGVGLQGPEVHLQGRPVWTLGFKCLWGASGSFFRSFDAPFANGLSGFQTVPGFLAAEKGLDASSPGAALMAAGKLFPRDGTNAFKPLEHITGLTFKTESLNGMLLRACRVAGVMIREGKITGFTRDPDTLQLEGGGSLTADLYLDATGSDALLATLAGNTAWTGYDLPCTRAATVLRRRGSEPIRPFTTLETLESGWRWRVEHDDSVGLGTAWNPDFTSDDQACAELVAKAGDPSLVPQVQTWNCGRRTAPWTGNVVAVGDANGFAEPLSSLRLVHLIRHVQWLVRILVENDGMPGDRSRELYNHVAAQAWDETRDFHAIHYRFNSAGTSDFWKAARETGAGDFAEFVDLFQSIGPSPLLANAMPAWPGVVGLEAWLAALLGLGVSFRSHPEIPAMEQKVWDSHCEQRRQMARQAVHAELCLGAARNAVKPAPRVPLP